MNEPETTCLTGEIVDESVEISLVELSRVSGASEQEIELWVAEGVFDPKGTAPREWRFSGASLRRARVAFRLARDLQVNASGIALALDLLDEIDALKSRSRASRTN
jgi:chaperone modulatory protein CbpM